jgi:UDP-N-acetylglucosamine transferase subunit ALG13
VMCVGDAEDEHKPIIGIKSIRDVAMLLSLIGHGSLLKYRRDEHRCIIFVQTASHGLQI